MIVEAWIPITVAAALLQNVRTALQKYLHGTLSTTAVTYVRFVYGLPLAFVYVLVLQTEFGYEGLPANTRFIGYVVAGGTTQILGTWLLVALFSLRNFAVGTTYSKTETVQAALFGVILLGDGVSLAAALGIGVSLVGIMLMSTAEGKISLREFAASWTEKSAAIGIASGAMFGISAVCYRAASLALDGEDAVMPAALTLVWVLSYQTLVMTVYLAVKEPGQLQAVWRSYRVSAWVGVTSMVGSAAWFTAMTLQNASYVRAVGQVELIFTFLISRFVFDERARRAELVGIGLVVGGILLLVLSR